MCRHKFWLSAHLSQAVCSPTCPYRRTHAHHTTDRGRRGLRGPFCGGLQRREQHIATNHQPRKRRLGEHIVDCERPAAADSRDGDSRCRCRSGDEPPDDDLAGSGEPECS